MLPSRIPSGSGGGDASLEAAGQPVDVFEVSATAVESPPDLLGPNASSMRDVRKAVTAVASEDRKIEDTPYGHRWYYDAAAKCVFSLVLAVLGLGAWNGYANGILQVLGLTVALAIGMTVALNRELTSVDPPRPPGGHHIVLTSHYKEERYLFDRLLNSVLEAQAHAKWPVTVVVAAEEQSLMMTEAWDRASLSPDDARVVVLVAIHPRGLEGERPGLGSNLRNAVRYIMEQTSLPVAGTMVTKVDGNCALSPQFFAQLEHAWATMDDTLCFQVHPLPLLDPCMEEYNHLSWVMRGMSRIESILQTIPTHVFYLCGFHMTFCMPLRMICRAGNWDPWMIQEDFLMLQRAVLASKGRIICRLLRASVYNAPCLDLRDLYQQRARCQIHGWFSLGFSLCNLGRLKGAPLTMMLFAYSVIMQMAMSVGVAGIPIICLVNSPEGVWSRQVNWAIGLSIQGLFVVFMASRAETVRRVPEALLTGPICGVLTSLLYLFLSVRFLFVLDSSQSYKTTRTLPGAKSGQAVEAV